MSPSQCRLVDVGKRALRVQVRGQGPTVVLEAGGAGEGTTAMGFGAALEDALAGFATVLTYDRAGSGSLGGAPRRSVAAMADDLAAVLDATGCAAPVTVVGWSAGGLVAEMFAVRHPGRVAGLVLLDPTCAMPDEPRGLQFLRLSLGAVQLAAGALAARLGLLRGRLGRRFARYTAGPQASAAGLDYAYRACNDPRSIWQLARAMPRFDRYVTETAAALADGPVPDIPVRVVVPRDRTGLPPTYAHRIDAAHAALARRFPRGRLVPADRTGHLVPIDRPDLVTAVVRELLQEND
ncbi:alpha/beta hydrolase [Mycobacterium sp. M1]|uniref:Alpha/beta hydrolase n=1 Tax=Mycolicibacter acidiphilus TaxID=2835306 RepID=A0ABS5RE46_9MYCO|nr:alpha/beta hydrolase [Mycolicibacter acidiphilus]MBS9532562.1 alpha/beta hydrolase [Mycolicibacter acidiphilus]